MRYLSSVFTHRRNSSKHARPAQQRSHLRREGGGLETARRSPVLNAATPSNPTGWFVYSITEGAGCSLSGDIVTAHALDVCIPDDTDGTVYNYDPDTKQVDVYTFYDNAACDGEYDVWWSEDIGVCTIADGTSETNYYVTSAELPFKHAHMAQQFSVGSNCDSPVMYTALRNNKCFIDGASGATKVEFPSVTYYNSFDSCSGSVSNKETVNADVCEAPTGTYDDYTEFSSFKISLIGSEPSSSSDELSDGAIAGIVVGSLAGVAIIAALIFFFFARKASSIHITS